MSLKIGDKFWTNWQGNNKEMKRERINWFNKKKKTELLRNMPFSNVWGIVNLKLFQWLVLFSIEFQHIITIYFSIRNKKVPIGLWCQE